MDFSIISKFSKKNEDKFSAIVNKNSHYDEHKENVLIGIHISSLGIHIIECAKSENGIFATCKHNMSFLEKVNPDNIEDISVRLQNCLSKVNCTTKLINVTRGVSNVSLIFKTIPSVSKKHLDNIIESEARKEQIDIQNSFIDYKILKEIEEDKTKKFFVIIVSIPRENVNKIVKLIEKIKLAPYCIDVIPLALIRLLKFNEDINPDFNSLLIYIGADVVSLNLIRGDLLCMNRHIFSVGECAIINTISENMKINFREAHKIKNNFILGKENIAYSDKDKQILELIKKVFDRRVIEIERSIQFFMNEYPPGNIEKVFLSGIDLMKGTDKYISQKIDLPVEIINPFKKLKINNEAEKKEENSSYAYVVATGLALRDFV